MSRMKTRIEALERRTGIVESALPSIFIEFFSREESSPVTAWALSRGGKPLVERLAGESDEDFNNRAVETARAMGKKELLVFFPVILGGANDSAGN